MMDGEERQGSGAHATSSSSSDSGTVQHAASLPSPRHGLH